MSALKEAAGGFWTDTEFHSTLFWHFTGGTWHVQVLRAMLWRYVLAYASRVPDAPPVLRWAPSWRRMAYGVGFEVLNFGDGWLEDKLRLIIIHLLSQHNLQFRTTAATSWVLGPVAHDSGYLGFVVLIKGQPSMCPTCKSW